MFTCSFVYTFGNRTFYAKYVFLILYVTHGKIRPFTRVPHESPIELDVRLSRASHKLVTRHSSPNLEKCVHDKANQAG